MFSIFSIIMLIIGNLFIFSFNNGQFAGMAHLLGSILIWSFAELFCAILFEE